MSRQERVRAGWAGVLVSAALLSACGGGGGDSTPPAPPPPTGVAIPDDMAIKATATTDVAAGTVFTSSVAATAGLTYLWTFGDGTTSTEASPKHDFAKVGDYAVSLKVTNAAGTSKEVKFNVTVNNRAHVQGLNCTGTDSNGWCWQAPLPTGSTQNDFAFIDASNGWSVGDNGEILRTRDGGKTWVRQVSGVSTRLTGVSFTDANNGWVAGEYGALLRTTDGGARWTLQPTGTAQLSSPTIQTSGANIVLLSGNGGGTRMSVDGGATWTQGGFSGQRLGADGVLWTMNYYGGLSKSSDQGKSTSVVLPTDVSNSYSTNSWFDFSGRALMVVTTSYTYVSNQPVYSQTVRTSADNGQTWTTITPQGLAQGTYSYGNGLSMVDATTASLQFNGGLYRTVDGGRNWTLVPVPTNQYSVSYSSYANGVVSRSYYDYSTGSGGYIYDFSVDAGATWTRARGFAGGTPKRINTTTWIANISDGTATISTDAMATWTRINGPDSAAASKTLQAFWFFDAKRGLGLSAGGDLVETTDGGRAWKTKVASLTPSGYYYSNVARFQFIDAKKGWLLAADGKIYLTDDAGASWVTPLQGSYRAMTAFHFVDAANGFALMNDSAASSVLRLLMVTTDGGKSWTQQSVLDLPYRDIKFSTPLKGVLVGDNGTLVTTADAGKSWTGRYIGGYGSLRQLEISEPGTMWLVGANGLMKFSKDDGATWQSPASSATTVALNAIRFLTPQQGWAVGEGGTVLTTVDGGKTWSKQVTGTQRSLNQVFFVDARTGWIAGEGGALLATGTGGL